MLCKKTNAVQLAVSCFALSASFVFGHIDRCLGSDLIALRDDFNRTLESVQSWEGNVRIKVTREPDPYTASGKFLWNRVERRFRCQIEYPATFNKLNKDSAIEKTSQKQVLREVIVDGHSRTAIWHGIPNSVIDGFSLPTKDKGRVFSIAYREPVEPHSLIVPQLEFCPEFLYRGQIPSMAELLEIAVASRDDPEIVNLHGIDTDGRYFIKTSDGSSTIYFATKQGVWLPSEVDTKKLKMAWEWSDNRGLLIPTKLSISDAQADQQLVYQVTDSKINTNIDENTFDYNSLQVSEGDYLVDGIEDVVLRFDGMKFVDPNEIQKHGDRGRFVWLSILSGIVLICVYLVLRKTEKST
ncbi:MAG: hypothetical protein ACF788_02350 [Novipirellula sp. JB048]